MIRVGPAGWSYKDWNGIVYPAKKPKGFHELSYLSEFFDTVELNVTFYRPIPGKVAEGWVKRIEHNRRFKFTGKLLRAFTHEREPAADDEKFVKEGFEPLLEAGRLGAVLMQFPASFKSTPENRNYLARLKDRFWEYPLVLEVRHSSWNEIGVLDFLDRLEIGLCNIDQPLFHKSVKPSAVATSSVGYIRLHGRNYKAWWKEETYHGERYDYLYGVDELEPWVDRIKAVAAKTKDTYAVTNNHAVGKAAVNATEISSILKGEPVKAPETLVKHYPELSEFTLPRRE